MSRHFLKLLVVVAALLAPCQSRAFSLLGAKATWMTTEIGYFGADAGGPMYLGEGYRYNMPVLTYAYDASFLRYFGTNGVAAIDSTMAIINALPDADKISDSDILDDTKFPTLTRRSNASADALGLLDLKSLTLAVMMEQMGVASPERYVWSLRAHFADAVPRDHFSVINPNYDPQTLSETEYVNGVLYSYEIIPTGPYPQFAAASFPVDPLASAWSSVADYTQTLVPSDFSTRGYVAAHGAGIYFPALTREDVAALRYLFRSSNYAVESLLGDVRASTGGALGVTGGNGDGALSSGGFIGGNSGTGTPWTPTFSILTAVPSTTGGSPWAPVVVSTNLTTNTITATTTNGLPRVVTALRPGVGSAKFVKISYDSILGATTQPYLVTWVDRYVTNRTLRAQIVSRTVVSPDIIFGAEDLGVFNPTAEPVTYVRSVDGYTSFAALNTSGGFGELAGPGIINSFKAIAFSKVGRYYLHVTPSPNIGTPTKDDGTLGLSWGSFSGGTNPIVAYPEGTSLRAIEALVKKGL